MRLSVPEHETFSRKVESCGTSVGAGDRKLENLARDSESSAFRIRLHPDDAHPAAQAQAATPMQGYSDDAAKQLAAVEWFGVQTVESVAAHVERGGRDGFTGRAVQKLNRPMQADPLAPPPFCDCIHTVSAGAKVHEGRCTQSTSVFSSQRGRLFLRPSSDSTTEIVGGWWQVREARSKG